MARLCFLQKWRNFVLRIKEPALSYLDTGVRCGSLGAALGGQ